MYWRRGGKEVPWARASFGTLPQVLAPFKGNKELVVVIKIDRDASFENMVNIIDELDLAGLTRFSLSTLSPEERTEVASL
jgi:biopolymer transport protein ExbD